MKTLDTNDRLTDQYFELIEKNNNDIDGRINARQYMNNSTAIVHHKVVESSFIPKLLNKKTYETMRYASQTAHRILCKVMQHYIDDSSYRSVFNFSKELNDLILLPRDYDSILPFARVDTFLDENTYELSFCEFNGDGSSGMNENREIFNSIKNSQTFLDFSKTHNVKTCELFKTWVNEFIAIYNTYKYKVENPHFAICDYLENGVVDEFYLYAQEFEKCGYKCSVCDVRDLVFDGKTLTDKNKNPINAVWRRCVTNDVIEHLSETSALIEAVKSHKVALIGSFAGHIVHDKQIFIALFNQRTQAFLSKEENDFIARTIPYTMYLESENNYFGDVLNNKDKWIIKPTDHYGADNVYAGKYYKNDKWHEIVKRCCDKNLGFWFLAQKYINPFKSKTLKPDYDIDILPKDKILTTPVLCNNINGLYLFNGVFAGVFSRLGPLPTISKDMKGFTAATVWVDCDD